MTPQDKLEIERLVAAMVDEGASAETTAELERLLLGRRDLQDYYCHCLHIHLLLDQELTYGGHRFAPLVRAEANSPPNSTRTECAVLSERIAADLNSLAPQPTSDRRNRRLVDWLMMAVAVGGIVFGAWRFSSEGPDAETEFKDSRPTPSLVMNSLGSAPETSFLVRDDSTVEMLGRLTRNSAITGMLLPATVDESSKGATLRSGTAWMRHTAGQHERGYVVALAPGQQMDVCIDTDAGTQNMLAILELTSQGLSTGKTLSFTNLLEERPGLSNRRTGWVGNFSESNFGSTTRYFLFTGSHILPQQSSDDSWYQSDYQIYLNNGEFTVIGWDDSGLAVVPDPILGEFTPDYDFNDIRATIRFTSTGEERPAGERESFLPPPTVCEPPAEALGIGYEIDVKPGQTYLLMISSNAGLQNAMRVVDADSRQIIWKHTGEDPPTGMARDRGVFLLRNDSLVVRRYEIQSEHRGVDPDRKWRISPHRVLADSEDGVIVGFEDSLEDAEAVDWNDIRVMVRWFD